MTPLLFALVVLMGMAGFVVLVTLWPRTVGTIAAASFLVLTVVAAAHDAVPLAACCYLSGIALAVAALAHSPTQENAEPR